MERNPVKSIIAAVITALLMPVVSCTLAVTLHRAAASGDVGAISRRLEMGDRVNQHDRYGWTPLHWAAYYSQMNAVKYLLAKGADPNCVTVDSYGPFTKGTTPLMLCAYYDYRVLAKVLVDAGANVHAKDDLGNTAITFAEVNNLLEMMTYLKEASKNR
ncbi:MAG TPA: ankyrin repeat domain-containing protein [Spirochaetota bacterium]|nr:ankyrin repeat domain-containing protein [Spirochaetota bacterium]HPC41216.1 ankyrin repeat domain-containing protein [Spirochaetota bacterium]HPL17491.1 ankyrin repeat domain-containing protein [Spirochaetota bacterium]HQF08172.1 ankyrin repeat domain-containing protein [Spirochaetota bacterium]HQH96941.1 ankyrin repeat domain-containing protein [Spirochaetota bacterium]